MLEAKAATAKDHERPLAKEKPDVTQKLSAGRKIVVQHEMHIGTEPLMVAATARGGMMKEGHC
jgi:uncharacterized protein YheU (UPF0270 family)